MKTVKQNNNKKLKSPSHSTLTFCVPNNSRAHLRFTNLEIWVWRFRKGGFSFGDWVIVYGVLSLSSFLSMVIIEIVYKS